jgi:hypothetical protein
MTLSIAIIADREPALLTGKVIVDPSNPIALDEHGQFSRNLPDHVSAGSIIAESLPPGTSRRPLRDRRRAGGNRRRKPHPRLRFRIGRFPHRRP